MTLNYQFKGANSRSKWLAGWILLLCGSQMAMAAGPAIDSIRPPLGGIDLTRQQNIITIVGTGFGTDPARVVLAFDPPGAVTKPPVVGPIANDLDGTNQDVVVALTLAKTVQGTITITPTVDGVPGESFPWNTNIAFNQCLETVKSTGCELRWEIDATGMTGSSSQTNKSNSPNFLMILDYQIAKNKDSKLRNNLLKKDKLKDAADVLHGARGLADRFGLHLVFKTGYTQVRTAQLISPVTSSSTGTTPPPSGSSPAACTGTSNSAATSCIAAAPQNAFIADVRVHGEWTFGQNGQAAYSAMGFGAHGSLENLIQNDQIVQSGGFNYAALSSLNPKNLVGIYDGFFRYRLAQPAHDLPANPDSTAYENGSDLLQVEFGIQYDSGLANLVADPKTNTRLRYAGRFYAFPELPNAKHTKIKVGLEVSAGMNGGPKIVQIIWGTNLNPLKLFTQ